MVKHIFMGGGRRNVRLGAGKIY